MSFSKPLIMDKDSVDNLIKSSPLLGKLAKDYSPFKGQGGLTVVCGSRRSGAHHLEGP